MSDADFGASARLSVAVEGEDQIRSLQATLQQLQDQSIRVNQAMSEAGQRASVHAAAQEARGAAEEASKGALGLGERIAKAFSTTFNSTIKSSFNILKATATSFGNAIAGLSGPLQTLVSKAGLGTTAMLLLGAAISGLAAPVVQLIGGFAILKQTFGWAKEGTDRQIALAGRTQRFFPHAVGEALGAAQEEMRTRMGVAYGLFGEAADHMQESVTRRLTAFRLGRGLRGEKDIFSRWGITQQNVEEFERRTGSRLDISKWLEQFVLKREELESQLQNAQTPEERAALTHLLMMLSDDTVKIFGQNFSNMMRALSNSDMQRFKQNLAAANRIGQYDQVKANRNAVDFRIALASIMAAFKGIKDGITNDVRPSITGFLNELNNKMLETKDGGEGLGASLRALGVSMGNAAWRTLREVMGKITPDKVNEWIRYIEEEFKPDKMADSIIELIDNIIKMGGAVAELNGYLQSFVNMMPRIDWKTGNVTTKGQQQQQDQQKQFDAFLDKQFAGIERIGRGPQAPPAQAAAKAPVQGSMIPSLPKFGTSRQPVQQPATLAQRGADNRRAQQQQQKALEKQSEQQTEDFRKSLESIGDWYEQFSQKWDAKFTAEKENIIGESLKRTVDLIPPTEVEEAPLDGKPHVRRNQRWYAGVEEAPDDEKKYARKGEKWIDLDAFSGGGGGSGGKGASGEWGEGEGGGGEGTGTDARKVGKEIGEGVKEGAGEGGGGDGEGASAAPSGPQPYIGQKGSANLWRGHLMADLQKDFNLTREQAAGIVGNLGHETGGFGIMQEARPRSGRGGWGLAQWTGSRRVDFERWVKQQGLDPRSYAANYGFLKHELTHGKGQERLAIGAVRGQKTVSGAMYAFERTFERSRAKAYGRRLAEAQKAYNVGAASTPRGASASYSAPTATSGVGRGQAGLVTEATGGKTRSRALSDRLRGIFQSTAAQQGLRVRVTSGGQAPKGSGGPRTGSPRHDVGGGRLGAADVQLVDQKTGRTLSQNNESDRARIANFISGSVARGASGVGAGPGYMNPSTIHVGGSLTGGSDNPVAWGRGNASANAPAWLREALRKGLAQRGRAEGGPIKAGMPYLVGEKGAEIVIPKQSGFVIPNQALDVITGMPLSKLKGIYDSLARQKAGVKNALESGQKPPFFDQERGALMNGLRKAGEMIGSGNAVVTTNNKGVVQASVVPRLASTKEKITNPPEAVKKLTKEQLTEQSNTVKKRLVEELENSDTGLGLKRYQAAALVGNLAHESMNFQAMQEITKGGLNEGKRGGWGYAQWTAKRRDKFEQWAKEQGVSKESLSSHEVNTAYLTHEVKKDYAGFLKKLRETKDLESATRLVHTKFEVPADTLTRYGGDPSGITSKSAPDRLKHAREALRLADDSGVQNNITKVEKAVGGLADTAKKIDNNEVPLPRDRPPSATQLTSRPAFSGKSGVNTSAAGGMTVEDGKKFGASAAEAIRDGLDGTNIGALYPQTSVAVQPRTPPKPVGGDMPTDS